VSTCTTDPAKTASKTKTHKPSETKSHHRGQEDSSTPVERRKDADHQHHQRAVHDNPAGGDVDPEEVLKDLAQLLKKCQNLDSKTDDFWIIRLCNALAESLPAGTGPILPVRDTTPSPDLQNLPGFRNSLKDKPNAPYTAILEYICPLIEKLKNLPPSGTGTMQVISASSTASPADVQAAVSSALGLAGTFFPLGGLEQVSKRQEIDLTGGHINVKPGSVINNPLPNQNGAPDRSADDEDDKDFLQYGANLDQDSPADRNFFANGGDNNDQDDADDNDFFENGRHNGTPDDDDNDSSSFSGGDNYGPIHGQPGHGGVKPPTYGDPGSHCEDPDEVDLWHKNTCRPSSQKPTSTGGSNTPSSYSNGLTVISTVKPTTKSGDPIGVHSSKSFTTSTSTTHVSAISTGAGIVASSSGACTASGDPRDSTKHSDTSTSKKPSTTGSKSYSVTATSTGDGVAFSTTSGSHGASSPTSSAGYGSSSSGDGRTHKTSSTKASDPATSTKSADGIVTTPVNGSGGTGYGGMDPTKSTKGPGTATGASGGVAGTKTTNTADPTQGVATGTSTGGGSGRGTTSMTKESHTSATSQPSNTPSYYRGYNYDG